MILLSSKVTGLYVEVRKSWVLPKNDYSELRSRTMWHIESESNKGVRISKTEILVEDLITEIIRIHGMVDKDFWTIENE